jgi:hypothetical protein
MNILFLGTTGVHHTLIAAYIYLGKTISAYHRDIKFWNDRSKEDEGYPIYIDQDEQHNLVFSLGAGKDVQMAAGSISELVGILNYTERDLVVKPIYIKNEKLLLFLYQISRFKLVSHLAEPVIEFLLNKEFAAINQQIEEFRSQVRFALRAGQV